MKKTPIQLTPHSEHETFVDAVFVLTKKLGMQGSKKKKATESSPLTNEELMRLQVMCGSKENVDNLLQMGVSPDEKINGNSARMLAQVYGRKDVVSSMEHRCGAAPKTLPSKPKPKR